MLVKLFTMHGERETMTSRTQVMFLSLKMRSTMFLEVKTTTHYMKAHAMFGRARNRVASSSTNLLTAIPSIPQQSPECSAGL